MHGGTRKSADVVRNLIIPRMYSKLKSRKMGVRSKLLLPDYSKCEMVASEKLDRMNGKM